MKDSPQETTVDVLVAGAGPAGCSAARAAAEAGAGVLLVDIKSEIGLPVRCAEFVPRPLAREVEIGDDAIAQAVDEMVVFVREEDTSEELGRVRSPGLILNRERFEAGLAKLATDAGAELVMGTRATPAADGAVTLTRDGGTGRVRPRVVVAADGPFSSFRPEGIETPCLPAAQLTVPLGRQVTWTEVHFAREFRPGYAWLFPKGDLANVGVGCAPEGGRQELVPLLDAFVESLRREGKLGGGEPVRRTAGWIPVWGPPGSAVAEAEGAKVLLAGDAGGFADPVTGAGIWPAIATGRFAGECAARAALGGDMSQLSAYDHKWRELFGAALSRSAGARRKMEAEWPSRDLKDLVRDVWPGL